MSIQLIQQYHSNVQRVKRYDGSHNEGAVRKPFHDLLEAYARQHNLEMIGELYIKTPKGDSIRMDGTLKDALQSDWGYWESKDEFDDLDVEIENKFAAGYPCNNILFEDTQTAVSVQTMQIIAKMEAAQR